METLGYKCRILGDIPFPSISVNLKLEIRNREKEGRMDGWMDGSSEMIREFEYNNKKRVMKNDSE